MTPSTSSGLMSRASRLRPRTSAILFKPFSASDQDDFPASLRFFTYASNRSSNRTCSRVACDLDAAAFLDDVGEVALEYLPCLRERHCWIGADLGFRAFSIAPLLNHPFRCHTGWHRFDNQG